MIYVECKPDEVLVRALTGLRRRDISHELKAKPEVANRIRSSRNARGLVDEDPLAPQPPYLVQLGIRDGLPDKGLRLLVDDARGNHIVVLCPRLEEWIVAAARGERVNLDYYNLPTDAGVLHRVINHRLPSFSRLVEDLRETDQLRALRGLLNS